MCDILYLLTIFLSQAGTAELGVISYLTKVLPAMVIRAVRVSGRRLGAISGCTFLRMARARLVTISNLEVRAFLSGLKYTGIGVARVRGGVASGAATK